MVELHREGSALAAYTAGLFNLTYSLAYRPSLVAKVFFLGCLGYDWVEQVDTKYPSGNCPSCVTGSFGCLKICHKPCDMWHVTGRGGGGGGAHCHPPCRELGQRIVNSQPGQVRLEPVFWTEFGWWRGRGSQPETQVCFSDTIKELPCLLLWLSKGH